jgi:cellulose synthase/poly-beta-1,6-N-acetylglucosamine synthase-like glycosyltransferase
VKNTVTIIIPCRNEEIYIKGCLESIINLDYSQSLLEVIVCDGKSDDKTAEIVNEYAKKYPFIKFFINEKITAPYALNLGIKNSTGKFITRIDAHSEVHPDFLKKSIAEFDNNSELGCVGGMLLNIYENKISKVISYAMSSGFGVGNAYFRTGKKDGFVDTLAFGTYKKEVFDKVGLFDEELVRNQDDEFNYRVVKAGYKILLKREIKANYYVRASFKKLFKQYFQYGYWKVYVNKKHSAITSIRQLVPLFFVLYLIFGLGLSFYSRLFCYFFLLVLLLYLILAISNAVKLTGKINEIVLVIFAFIILHTSYGLGYLEGIFNFILLRRSPAKEYTSLSR